MKNIISLFHKKVDYVKSFEEEILSGTDLNSSFHDFLAVAHVCHAKFAQFLMKEPALALPEAALTVDDTCGRRGAVR